MMREIAAKAGNFRGVCPTIGRLSECCTRRISPGAVKPACHCAGFFVAWSDTHESVESRTLTDEARDKSNSIRIKEETPKWLRKK